MVLTLFVADNAQPERVVTYLAAAETEARYGIYPLDQVIDQPVPGSGATGGVAQSDAVATLPSVSPAGPGDTPGGAPRGTTPGGTGHRPPLLAGLLPPGGWRWIAEHPLDAMKLLFLWAVLLSPIHLAARRWLLLQRNRVLQEAIG
jgi:hypothetical protein